MFPKTNEAKETAPLMPEDNAPDVPAFQEDSGAQDGELHNQLKAEGVLDNDYPPEQASKEAEAAASEENARKAAKQSRYPHLIVGARVRIKNESPQHAGRNGSVESILWESQDDEVLAGLGTPESRFAKAKSYDIRFRDGVGGSGEVPAEFVEEMSQLNFGRGLT